MSRRGSYGGPPQGQSRAGNRGPGQLPPLNGKNELASVFGQGMIPPPPAKPNVGLVFDRYLRIWRSDSELVKERFEPLNQFVEEYSRCRQHLEPWLEQTHARLRSLVGGPDRGEQVATTQARLVSGLGGSHPLENGFCFDYISGIPHLPGSAVKGLCRQGGEISLDEITVRTLLGSGDEDADRFGRAPTVGDLVFFAAYPERWPKIEVDVINCHQQDYYGSDPVVLRAEAKERRVGPLEVESPVPVFFLTVAKGTQFVFRCASLSGNYRNVEQALGLLKDGLAELGIGAKTALGYGVMMEGS